MGEVTAIYDLTLDAHALAFAEAFSIPVEYVTKQQRAWAKYVAFGARGHDERVALCRIAYQLGPLRATPSL